MTSYYSTTLSVFVYLGLVFLFSEMLSTILWAFSHNILKCFVQNLEYHWCFQFLLFADFYNPLLEDEEESNTVVQIMYPTEPPVSCLFLWENFICIAVDILCYMIVIQLLRQLCLSLIIDDIAISYFLNLLH